MWCPTSWWPRLVSAGKVCVFTDAATHLLADVVGYLPAGPGYAPLSPARLLDTRSANSTVDGLFAGGGRRGAGSVLELAVTGRGGVPVGAAAVVVNVTVVDPLAAGFATLFPCGSAVPVASSLNYGPGDVVPNELVAKVGVGGQGVFVHRCGDASVGRRRRLPAVRARWLRSGRRAVASAPMKGLMQDVPLTITTCSSGRSSTSGTRGSTTATASRPRAHHLRRLGRRAPAASAACSTRSASPPTAGWPRSPGTPPATSSCTSPRRAPGVCCTR